MGWEDFGAPKSDYVIHVVHLIVLGASNFHSIHLTVWSLKILLLHYVFRGWDSPVYEAVSALTGQHLSI